MASYELLIKPSAAKELEAVASRDRKRLAQEILRLRTDARPIGSEKLSGQERYRLRQGDYRVLYTVDDDAATVVIFRVAHRRDVYR